MQLLHAGLDIGSTTVKAVVLDDNDNILFSRYMRHFADIKNSAMKLLEEIRSNYLNSGFTLSATGSGALSFAEEMDVPFTQEQIACSCSVERYLPTVNVCIELGGEDAKLTFFDSFGADQRMNETCAGGTGAFLDQMAALLGIDVAGLNELAKNYKVIYPIASRCGVFAKTDVQALLNDGASRPDVAASIFQAIVNQTISGLACGRKIKGNVAFLGGPLYFLPELRKRFAETLKLTSEQCISPENPHLFVAIGAAITAKKYNAVNIAGFEEKAKRLFVSTSTRKTSELPPLFEDEDALTAFKKRHLDDSLKRAPLEEYKGDAFMGIDVGSTTTKVALISDTGNLLFSRYVMNGGGEPVKTVRSILSDLYSDLPDGVRIRNSAVTGYGEKLIQTAFGVDIGEVETVAHARAARFFRPDVDFIIDIGGQDMKCLGVKNGFINRVSLNEACSSGCGSFLQSFAESLHMSVADFAREAEKSRTPVDLGTRCTVFMNSRVRQAQKEGAAICDISAGLVYSVVRNALYKVLKIKNPAELGEHIVVQGGTFMNDALLRAFELLTGRDVVRPAIPGLMGAFGSALLARDRWVKGTESKLASAEEIKNFSADTSTYRCHGCSNVCILTRTKFGDGSSYITGNRCEKGSGRPKNTNLPPNLFELKYSRLFDYYKPLEAENAARGIIGIPRVMNMYEDYPYWFTFFTKLGFRVELSQREPDKNLGIETIPSQTVCYPAKVVHRHITDLLERGVKRIFYPILMTDTKQFEEAQKHFNCPVVIGYPDLAYLNIDALRASDVEFLRPAVRIESKEQVAEAISKVFSSLDISRGELLHAAEAAEEAESSYHNDIAKLGKDALSDMKKRGCMGIILAGHPYHLDPEVNHGIPQLINSYGVTVFTEDTVCWMAKDLEKKDDVSVIDQWVFHSRLYRAAMVAARHPDFSRVELIQLNSFGCGLDAISTDQTAMLLEENGKLYTLLKIDEGKNNGAVNIRIRSLLAAMNAKKDNAAVHDKPVKPARTEAEGLAGRTLLCPPLSSHHFQFLDTAFASAGINLKVLPEGGRETAEIGWKFINNDMCYPSAIVVGQFIKALQSGEYDPEKTDCIYAQTGGLCRASNYVRLLRRALDAAGFTKVRVIALNAQKDSGAEPLSVPMKVAWRSLLGIFYGDMLMRLSLRTRPYEILKGETNRIYDVWKERARENVKDGSLRKFKSNIAAMVHDFSSIGINETRHPRVGVVGEILVKYHACANNHIVQTIENEGGEAVVPDFVNFMLYCIYDKIYQHGELDAPLMPSLLSHAMIAMVEMLRAPIRAVLKGTRFGELSTIYSLSAKSKGIVSQSNQGGEGWLLTSEMVNLIENGVKNILCIQPFACLPDHITGKGVIKELKRRYRSVNVLALDFDSSVSSVNQLNRIKLLMATSKV